MKANRKREFLHAYRPIIETHHISDDPHKYMARIRYTFNGTERFHFGVSDEGGTRSQAKHRAIQLAMAAVNF